MAIYRNNFVNKIRDWAGVPIHEYLLNEASGSLIDTGSELDDLSLVGVATYQQPSNFSANGFDAGGYNHYSILGDGSGNFSKGNDVTFAGTWSVVIVAGNLTRNSTHGLLEVRDAASVNTIGVAYKSNNTLEISHGVSGVTTNILLALSIPFAWDGADYVIVVGMNDGVFFAHVTTVISDNNGCTRRVCVSNSMVLADVPYYLRKVGEYGAVGYGSFRGALDYISVIDTALNPIQVQKLGAIIYSGGYGGARHLISNNAESVLQVAITADAADDEITVAITEAPNFGLPNRYQIQVITLSNVAGTIFEIVHAYVRDGVLIGVRRAQEGTNLQAWGTETIVSVRVPAQTYMSTPGMGAGVENIGTAYYPYMEAPMNDSSLSLIAPKAKTVNQGMPLITGLETISESGVGAISPNSVALGLDVTAEGEGAVVVGVGAIVSEAGGVALGHYAEALAADAISLGRGNRNTHSRTVRMPASLIPHESSFPAEAGVLNNFTHLTGSEIIVFSMELDAGQAGETDSVAIPPGCLFYPTEVGAVYPYLVSPPCNPTLSWGTTGDIYLLVTQAVPVTYEDELVRILTLGSSAGISTDLHWQVISADTYANGGTVRMYTKGYLIALS